MNGSVSKRQKNIYLIVLIIEITSCPFIGVFSVLILCLFGQFWKALATKFFFFLCDSPNYICNCHYLLCPNDSCLLPLHIKGNPIDILIVQSSKCVRCSQSEILLPEITISNLNEYTVVHILWHIFHCFHNSTWIMRLISWLHNTVVQCQGNRSIIFVRRAEHVNFSPFHHNALNLSWQPFSRSQSTVDYPFC